MVTLRLEIWISALSEPCSRLTSLSSWQIRIFEVLRLTEIPMTTGLNVPLITVLAMATLCWYLISGVLTLLIGVVSLGVALQVLRA